MSAVWRCRVCEGVNQGGRTCATCGAVVAAGEPIRAAVRTRLPSTAPAAPPPVPPTVPRRELRQLPTFDDLLRDPDALFTPGARMEIHPIPGGCLMAPIPRRRRPRWY